MAFLTLQTPAVEPVTVAQLISYGHIDSNEDQSFLAMLVTQAREACEAFCERAFIFQTKRLLMDFFPGYIDMKMAGQRVSSPFVSGSNAVLVGIRYAIMLPWPSVRQVLSLQYQDPTNGSMATMTPGTDFTIDIDSQPARLTPVFGRMWPVARVAVNAVQVDFVTGYSGPIAVSMNVGSPLIISPFKFLPRDIGSPISIPNAADGKTPLTGKIVSVDMNGQATLDQAAGATTTPQTTTFGVVPASIQNAILALAMIRYEKRLPDDDANLPKGVQSYLGPYRDLRL